MTEDKSFTVDRHWWAARSKSAFVTATPTLTFVAVAGAASRIAAIVAAGVVALAWLVYRFVRRQPKRDALIGIATVAVCGVVAEATGETRGFFLVPAILPSAIVVACLGSIAVRRPLTGLLLNRIAGGPVGWSENTELRRVYILTTGAAAVVDAVNGALQIFFYERRDTVVLAIAHIATGPLFAGIVAATIIYARRAMRSTASTMASRTGGGLGSSCE